MRVDFHPNATLELEESADWYAERSEDAASGFALAIDEALNKIAHHPDGERTAPLLQPEPLSVPTFVTAPGDRHRIACIAMDAGGDNGERGAEKGSY